MTKIDSDQKQLKDTIALGERNKGLIPSVKNSCKHMNIENVSRGLIAEMYNLPISLRISCPHSTGGSEAMNFEWIARDFILGYCQSCEFKQEIHPENFGNDVINDHKKQQENLMRVEEEEKEKKLALATEVHDLIAKEKSKGEITILSILNLIQSFEEHTNKNIVAGEVLEASKLSPQFFSDIALDSLSLLFDNIDFGERILLATEHVLRTGRKLSPFAFDRLISAIEKNRNLDSAVGILRLAIDDKDIRNYDSLVKIIFDTLWYKRRIGDPYDSHPIYPNCMKFLNDVYEKGDDYLNELINKQLEVNDKTKRININYLLQELISVNPKIITPCITTIIKSLELEDDKYEESADRITCLTLSKIYAHSPDVIIMEIDKVYPNLSLGAKVELIHFFKIVLMENDLVVKSDEITHNIIDRILQILLAKETAKELKAKALSTITDISKKKSGLIIDHFDVLIGFLVNSIKDFDTFNWYVKELDKPKDQISTFNPFQSDNYLNIQSRELELKRIIQLTETTIQNLIKNSVDSQNHVKILDIISNLDSASDGYLKSELIAVIRRSVNNPIYLAELLPTIYNYLLDTDSKQVRYEGINFITHLIDNNDQLVTQTLIDIIKVFMKDIDRGIKGKSFEAFGSVIRKFPHQVEDEQIQIILQAVIDSYVVIHKRAADLSYKILPFLTKHQKLILISRIAALEESYYNEKDFKYCQELVDILLFITKENQEMYVRIVKDYVVKYCNSKDYYTDVDFIEKLTRIRNQSPEFNELWLQQTIGFLSRTKPDYCDHAFDSRNELFKTIYHLPQNVITQNILLIKELIRHKIDGRYFTDVFELYGILGFFNLHHEINDMSNYFKQFVEQNKSNEFATKTNQCCERIANIETSVANQLIDEMFIKSIRKS